MLHEAAFESVYEVESGRWTLRRIRVDRECETMPAPSGTMPTPPVRPIGDLVVPVRREIEVGVIDVTAAFLLMHVDGRSSIAEIACYTSRPVVDVAAAFAMLAAMGVVDLIG